MYRLIREVFVFILYLYTDKLIYYDVILKYSVAGNESMTKTVIIKKDNIINDIEKTYIRNVKMIIAYDGGRYNGWQKQGNTNNTIQEKFEELLRKIFEKDIEVNASGRTDAGVNAIGQVINFHIDKRMEIDELVEKMNRFLPKDIRVISGEYVQKRFHARLNAVGKHYVYRIDNADIANIFERKYLYRIDEKLDINKMKKACMELEGEHDFASFCANKKMKKSTVRNVYKIVLEEKDGVINLHFYGNGFLYNMVRIMAGTIIEAGLGRRSTEEIKDLFKIKDRSKAGFLAPANGLFLVEVFYNQCILVDKSSEKS